MQLALPFFGENIDTTGAEATASLFGVNFLFNRDGDLEVGSISRNYAEFVSDAKVSTLRYPGGTIAESEFDLRNPNAPNQNFMNPTENRSEPTVGISDFLGYVSEIGASATIVLPTYRFLSSEPDESGHRTIVDTHEADLRAFIRFTLSEADRLGVEIDAYEVGNEWWVDNSAIFGFQMTPVEYGRVAAYMSKILQEEINRYYHENDLPVDDQPDIVVQVGPGGRAEWYTADGFRPPEGYKGQLLSATELIFNQFSDPLAAAAVDGVVTHRYLTGTDSGVTGWAYTPFEIWKALANESSHFNSPTLYVKEWNVAARNQQEVGLRQFDSMFLLVAEMLEAGVEHANVWAVQQGNQTRMIQNRGNADEAYGGLSFGGLAFDIMSAQLPGLRVIEAGFQSGDMQVVAFGSADSAVYAITNKSPVETGRDIVIPSGLEAAHHVIIYEVNRSASGSPDVTVRTIDPRLHGDSISIQFSPDETVVLVVSAGVGGVYIEGYNQNDTINGSDFNDSIEGGAGNDVVHGGSGHDRILGGDGNDTLGGGSGADTVYGGAGNDLISGEDGDDVLIEGSGSDTLSGGTGADLFVMERDGAVDTITDFQLGIDRIDLSAWGPIHSLAALTITATATGARVTYGNEMLEIHSANGLSIDPGIFRAADFIGVGEASPSVRSARYLEGSGMDEIFVFSPGNDTINGGRGFDLIDFGEASGPVTVNLGHVTQVSGLAGGQRYSGIEGVIG